MDIFTPQELKTVLYSKRANIFYLEKCRVMQKDGRVLYLTEGKKAMEYWNIPIANTTVILLGTGTSISQAAVRCLASAGVMIGFCGNGCTPLFAGTEIEWLSPQSEYRPTQYIQGWMQFWFDESKRLQVAKNFQNYRCDFLEKIWHKDRELNSCYIYSDDMEVVSALAGFRSGIKSAQNVQELLSAEAHFAKALYKYVAGKLDIDDFVRDPNAPDLANVYLNHGNYLAYGLAASVLWVLGIPHGFAVMHGKTRRGALVFDVADLIKDILVLPFAFICSGQGYSHKEFRQQLLVKFTEHNALDFMYDIVKEQSQMFVKGEISP